MLPPILILPIVADLTSQMQPRQTAPLTVPDDSYNSQPACAHAHRTSFSKSTTSRNTVKRKISSKGNCTYTQAADNQEARVGERSWEREIILFQVFHLHQSSGKKIILNQNFVNKLLKHLTGKSAQKQRSLSLHDTQFIYVTHHP